MRYKIRYLKKETIKQYTCRNTETVWPWMSFGKLNWYKGYIICSYEVKVTGSRPGWLSEENLLCFGQSFT